MVALLAITGGFCVRFQFPLPDNLQATASAPEPFQVIVISPLFAVHKARRIVAVPSAGNPDIADAFRVVVSAPSPSIFTTTLPCFLFLKICELLAISYSPFEYPQSSSCGKILLTIYIKKDLPEGRSQKTLYFYNKCVFSYIRFVTWTRR